MHALLLTDYMNLQYTEVPDPLIGENDVLVRVKAAGICGSDIHGFDGSTGRRIPPLIMGHEASGIIEKTGRNVTGWKVGDRVTFDSTVYDPNDWFSKKGMYNLSDGREVLGVSAPEFRRNGAFAEFVTVPSHILYALPETVSFTEAALVEPASVALHAINISPIESDDVAIVLGCGMVGIFLIQILQIRGIRQIIAVDNQEQKRDLAMRSGATADFDPADPGLLTTLHECTGGRGADVVFEVVGIEETVNRSIALVRKGGTVTLVGNLAPKVSIPLQAIVTRQIRLQGSCAINGEYPEVLQLISAGKLNMRSILSAEAPLSEGPGYFHRLYNKDAGLMKVVLIP